MVYVYIYFMLCFPLSMVVFFYLNIFIVTILKTEIHQTLKSEHLIQLLIVILE